MDRNVNRCGFMGVGDGVVSTDVRDVNSFEGKLRE